MTAPGNTIDQLKAEIERLKAENEALLKLASHDMRSPLNKLFALVNLLKMTDAPLSEEQRGYLENMEQVLSEGLQQMRNLVELRAIENDQVIVNLEPIDLTIVLNKIVREFIPMASRKGISISTKLDPVSTFCDRLIIGRILDQLLLNAIKFSPRNTEIKVQLRDDGDVCVISVIDGGHGINPEEQPDLFKKFKVLSTRTTGGESKAGLGLFLAQKYAGKLRGTIRYESGNTSVFILELPKTNLA